MSTEQNAVTAEPGNGPAAIRARVGDSAIDKVTRLFSAGLADIFTETLQNSRRGGCPSSKQMGLLSVFHKGGFGSSLFDVKPLGFDGSSGGFGWSVF